MNINYFVMEKKKERTKVQVPVSARLREIIYENPINNNNTFIIRSGTFNEYCAWNVTPSDCKERHANVRFFSSSPEKHQNKKPWRCGSSILLQNNLHGFLFFNPPSPLCINTLKANVHRQFWTVRRSRDVLRAYVGILGHDVPSVRANICWR